MWWEWQHPFYEFNVWLTIYHENFYDLVSADGCGCKDSDGLDFFQKGAVFKEHFETSMIPFPSFMQRAPECESNSECLKVVEDTCIDPNTGAEISSSDTLREYRCTPKGVGWVGVTCPQGCADGACGCPDTDGGWDFYNKGTVEGHSDECIDAERLREWSCGTGDQAAADTEVVCPFGCQDGACVCEDSDGGHNYDVRGSVGTNEDYCSDSRWLVEYYAEIEDGECTLKSETLPCPDEGRCQEGACLPPSCDDGIRNQGEEDVDCGGPCSECGYVGISGYLQYEEGDPQAGGAVNPRGFKPIRYAKVRLRGYGVTVTTRWNGHFEFVVPRKEGKEFYLKLKAHNYAARVEKDWDACNEYVWWESDRRVTPATGDIDLGVLRVGIDTDLDFRGYWKERESPWYEAWACGGDTHDIEGGSAYFNIAETILLARTYANGNRSEDDSIGRVDVAYPDPSWITDNTPWTNPFYGEIYLPPPTAGIKDGRDIGFLDETIIHEYTHHLAEEISENHWALAHHDMCSDISLPFAWFEGFAEYMSAYLTNWYRGGTRFLSQEGTYYPFAEDHDCDGYRSPKIEGDVLAVLWDLVDEPGSAYPDSDPDEDFDTIENEDGTIFQIFDKEMDAWVEGPDLYDFLKAWYSRKGREGIVPIVRENCEVTYYP